MTKIMSPEELEQELRAIGAERYHDKHPFHKLLHGGKLNKGQVQAWALNRYCYQSAVPRKDAALMSRCHDRELRRDWIHRIMDHDGFGEEEGGIERGLVLTPTGSGLPRLRHLQEARCPRPFSPSRPTSISSARRPWSKPSAPL